MSASRIRIATLESPPILQRIILMDNQRSLSVGESFHSKRTGRKLTITALKDDKVYYEVEGFKTIAPLFLPREKFLHLVGRTDDKE